MNTALLKDWKTAGGFVLAMVLGVLAIILAANDNESWIFATTLSTASLALAAFRADRLSRRGKGDTGR